MDGAATNAMTKTVKQAVENIRKPQKRAGGQKFHCVVLEQNFHLCIFLPFEKVQT